MNDLELKQLRKIAKAVRRLLDAPFWIDAPPSARFQKAFENLEKEWRTWDDCNQVDTTFEP